LLLPDAEIVIGYDRRKDFCDMVSSDLGEHPNLRVVHGDLDALDVSRFASERLDTVVCVNVLEHIEDDIALLRRFREMVVPDGRVVLFVPAHPWLYGAHDAADGHFRRYTRQSLRNALGSAGLQVERLRWVNMPGIVGWWLNRRRQRVGFDDCQCRTFDRMVPIIAAAERLIPPPVGLSLLAVGRKEV
jgi:SAM-dependent methyltransferase